MTEQKQKRIKPPKLLRGLFTLTVAITCSILFVAWGIIQYQVEQLVATRTSEYAHSIAQIAANSSAEALLSGDKLQLRMLVENVAKDPYIKSATIYAEDGQVAAQYPELLTNIDLTEPQQDELPDHNEIKGGNNNENSRDESLLENLEEVLTNGSTPAISRRTRAFIQAQDDIPFIEKIVYQQVTAGWFKISLNRQLLESSFRQSLHRSQQVIMSVASFLFFILLILLFRYEKRVKNLVNICHRLIQINAPQLPEEKLQWMECLRELSETRFQSLAEHPLQLPQEQSSWSSAQQTNDTIFCFCEFSLNNPQHEEMAKGLSQAEQYLRAAVQAHGLQSQGDILSGCLIPFLESNDANEGLIEITTLIATVRECLTSLDISVSMRVFIARGSILILENDRGVINGISLTRRLQEKFNILAAETKADDTICIAFEAEQLATLGEFSEFNVINKTITAPLYKLDMLSEPLKQQIQRQINFIMSNNSFS